MHARNLQLSHVFRATIPLTCSQPATFRSLYQSKKQNAVDHLRRLWEICLCTTLCIVLVGKIQFILPLMVVSHVSLQTFETVSSFTYLPSYLSPLRRPAHRAVTKSFTYDWKKKNPNACLNTNNTIADIFILLKLAVIHIEIFSP